MMSDARMPSWVSDHQWYHEIDLGNGIVINAGKGQPNLIPVLALLNKLELKGRACLDIGTWDGKMAFEMERRGAARVVAVDFFDRETFRLLHEYFNSEVEYIPGVHVDNLVEILAGKGPFDFILFSGVLYHVFNPLLALANVRCLMKPGGLAVVETACLDRDDVAMHFNQDGRFYRDLTTFWVMSVQCFRYLLGLCCFRPLQEDTLIPPAWGRAGVVRHAILARAVKPSEIVEVDNWLYRNTWKGQKDPGMFRPLDYAAFEAQDYDESSIIKCADELAGKPLAASNEVHWWSIGDSLKAKLYRKVKSGIQQLMG